MASSYPIFCNMCETQSNTNMAVKWCFECEGALCPECLQYHSDSKFTLNHTSIDIENYRNLPSYILKIKPYCDEHKAKFKNYCTTHDSLCCSKCIINLHKECDPLPSLEDVIRNVKTSTALSDIEERLENLKSFFAKFRAEKDKNISGLKSEKENIMARIQQIRITLNQHLYELETDLIQRLSEVENTHRTRIEKMCIDVKQSEQNVTELMNSIPKMRKFASDIQVFLARQKLEDEVIEKERMMGEISTDTQNIVFEENTILTSFHWSLTSLGDLSVWSRPSDIQKSTPKSKQAQIISTRTNYFDNLNLVLEHNVKVRAFAIFGCVLMENESSVFSDFDKSCLLVRNVYSGKEYCINMPGNPYDIICIDNKTLAVTSNVSNEICIVDLDKRQVKKSIRDEKCCGICLSDGKLLYSTKGNGLKEIELSNYNIRKLNIGNFIGDEYVAARNNKIYCTNNKTSSVTCYNSDYSVAWVFQNSILKGPRGITVDYHSNIYVAGLFSDNVVVISPDGQKFKEFKLKIRMPRTLYFEDKSNQILICGEKGSAGIFSIIV